MRHVRLARQHVMLARQQVTQVRRHDSAQDQPVSHVWISVGLQCRLLISQPFGRRPRTARDISIFSRPRIEVRAIFRLKISLRGGCTKSLGSIGPLIAALRVHKVRRCAQSGSSNGQYRDPIHTVSSHDASPLSFVDASSPAPPFIISKYVALAGAVRRAGKTFPVITLRPGAAVQRFRCLSTLEL